MSRFIITTLMLAALLFPLTAAAGLFTGTVPSAADDIADKLDDQLMARFAGGEEREAATRANIMIMGTTPVNINNLERTCPLARQMMEELSSELMGKGYRFQELRKGRDIRFDKMRGEFLLTRDVRKLNRTTATSHAIMTGTYVITPKQVRFNIRLIHTPGNEVLGMASATIPITNDLRPLLYEGGRDMDGGGMVPPIRTRLQ